MPIINHRTNDESYSGCVIRIYDHYWLDGMLEEIAVCWNNETKDTEHITVGYYGIDCRNQMDTTAKVDLTAENARDLLHHKKAVALYAFADSVQKAKQEIRKDDVCRVVRGRKIKKGTVLRVFWVGEKPTYFAQTHAYSNETETIAGCYDENGGKVWIKAEYLEKLPECRLKSPSAKERKKFVKWYMADNYSAILKVARG